MCTGSLQLRVFDMLVGSSSGRTIHSVHLYSPNCAAASSSKRKQGAVKLQPEHSVVGRPTLCVAMRRMQCVGSNRPAKRSRRAVMKRITRNGLGTEADGDAPNTKRYSAAV